MTLKKVSLVYYFLVFFMVLGCATEQQQKPNRPNIIYILADDLGYGDLKYYNNNSKIKTPHLDRLARQGMSFMDMHSTSSVCTPTRYSILTGEYAWRTQLKKGVLWSYGPLMIPDQKETVAKLLQRNDYQTAVVGKWHLGLDWQLKPNYREDQVIRRAPGMVTDHSEEIIDFSKNPTKGPRDVGFDYSYILPASLDIPPYVYLENEKFTQPVNDYSDGSNLDGDKDYDFWRPGPMAEGFDFHEVLPTTSNAPVASRTTYLRPALTAAVEVLVGPSGRTGESWKAPRPKRCPTPYRSSVTRRRGAGRGAGAPASRSGFVPTCAPSSSTRGCRRPTRRTAPTWRSTVRSTRIGSRPTRPCGGGATWPERVPNSL